jgi:arylsulfatase A-like enzyme
MHGWRNRNFATLLAICTIVGLSVAHVTRAEDKKPNIVMLMMDDTGWNDFGAYSGGGAALGHPTPNIDRIAKERVVLTSWYDQASCTAGRASFMTGRVPIRLALSIVVAPADANFLHKETPTIAEFFKKNSSTTYFSGKWHLGDKPESYPIEHGFDEMKNFAAYYAGVYSYPDTSKWFHPWFPSFNPEVAKYFSENVNLSEWEGVAGQRAKNLGPITYERFATFDEDQASNAINYVSIDCEGPRAYDQEVQHRARRRMSRGKTGEERKTSGNAVTEKDGEPLWEGL